jgi:hypothetical protein
MVDKKNKDPKKNEIEVREKTFEEKEREISERFYKTLSELPFIL